MQNTSPLSWSSKMRSRMYLILMRLYFWLQRKAARKALKLIRLCCSLLDAEIRLLQPSLLQLGEDDRLDLVVEYIARQLTAREIIPSLDAVLEDPRIAELMDAARRSEDVLQVVGRYHATKAFFADLLKDEEGKNKQTAMASAAVADIAPYDAGAVYREHTKTVTRLNKVRKELAERSALKVEFSISAIAGSVGLITAVLVVAGFLHVHYFYRRMGVDVSMYFSASDYLAASVEQIRAGAFAAVLALALFVMGLRAGSLRSRLHLRAMAKIRRREAWAVAFFTVALGASSAYSIYHGTPNFSQLRLAGLVLAYWVADYVARAFFKNHLVATTTIVAALIFGLNVGVSAYERSEMLLTGRSEGGHQKLHLKSNTPAITGELFGANSSYYFIYDRHMKATYVVPRERIEQIDITNKVQ